MKLPVVEQGHTRPLAKGQPIAQAIRSPSLGKIQQINRVFPRFLGTVARPLPMIEKVAVIQARAIRSPIR